MKPQWLWSRPLIFPAFEPGVGINFLINLRVQRRKAGGEVILVDPQPNVLKILKMLGLLEVLLVAPTVEEAWSQMRAKIKPDAPSGAGEVPLIE